jgi:hypothetical protein
MPSPASLVHVACAAAAYSVASDRVTAFSPNRSSACSTTC